MSLLGTMGYAFHLEKSSVLTHFLRGIRYPKHSPETNYGVENEARRPHPTLATAPYRIADVSLSEPKYVETSADIITHVGLCSIEQNVSVQISPSEAAYWPAGRCQLRSFQNSSIQR